MKEKKLLTLVGSICLILILAALPFMGACAPEEVTPPPLPPAEGEDAPPPVTLPKTVRILTSEEPKHLNGFEEPSGSVFMVLYQMLEGLTEWDGIANEVLPCLATSWEMVDSETWRFYLRQGVKFHNGEELNADAVKATVDYAVEKVQLMYEFGVAGAQVVDEYTIDITSFGILPNFDRNMSYLPIVAPECLADPMGMQHSPIGTGPYQMGEWKRGQYLTMKRFEGYWGTKPPIEEINWRWLEEAAVRLAALLGGEVDITTPLLPEQAPIAPKVVWGPIDDLSLIRLEVLGPDRVWHDQRMREAVACAINVEDQLAIFHGYAEPAFYQFSAEGTIGFDSTFPKSRYDPERAKALIEEAGYDGQELLMACATGLWIVGERRFEKMGADLQAVGLNVRVVFMPKFEFGNYLFYFGDFLDAPKADVLPSDASSAAGDPYGILGKMLIAGGKNVANSDQYMLELYNQIQEEADYETRDSLLKELYAYNYDECYIIPILWISDIWGVGANVDWTFPPHTFAEIRVKNIRFTGPQS